MQILNAEEFIQNYLIDDIGNMLDKFPYHSFLAMAAGIEYLGKVLNPNEDWNAQGESGRDFNNAISSLKAFEKYKILLDQRGIDFYKSFRCGLLHAFAPKYQITLSSKDQEPHLTEKKSRLNLRVEDFYLDFKAACEEIIKSPNLITKKDMTANYFHVPGYEINTSGSTSIPVKSTVAFPKKNNLQR